MKYLTKLVNSYDWYMFMCFFSLISVLVVGLYISFLVIGNKLEDFYEEGRECVKEDYLNDLKDIEINGCQYVLYAPSCGNKELTHKGNCTNH